MSNSTLRPQDRTDVALFYAAQPPHYSWNSVLRQIASTRNDGISRTPRIAAVMNMSLSDAFITVFESKYYYRNWRPVSDAHVFGGIHFRFDQDAGERIGREVGRYVNHNRLRPLLDEE